MRSVFIFHKTQTSRSEITTYLDRQSSRKFENNWQFGPTKAPYLYASIHDDLLRDFETEDFKSAVAALGRVPTLMTMIDVSGRIKGYLEVCELTELLLGSFGGIAQDDHSPRSWTLDEIVEDRRLGHPQFFLGD